MKRWIAVVALATLMAGCAAVPSKSNIKQPYVTQTRYTSPVSLDRYGQPLQGTSRLWIYVDGDVIGSMQSEKSTTFYLPRGPHSISLAVAAKPVPVGKAKTKYITVRYPVGPVVKVLLVGPGPKVGKMRVIRTY